MEKRVTSHACALPLHPPPPPSLWTSRIRRFHGRQLSDPRAVAGRGTHAVRSVNPSRRLPPLASSSLKDQYYFIFLFDTCSCLEAMVFPSTYGGFIFFYLTGNVLVL